MFLSGVCGDHGSIGPLTNVISVGFEKAVLILELTKS